MDKDKTKKFSFLPSISNSSVYVEKKGILIKSLHIVLKDKSNSILKYKVNENSFVTNPLDYSEVFNVYIKKLRKDDDNADIVNGNLRFNRLQNNFSIMLKMESDEVDIMVGIVSEKKPSNITDLYNSNGLGIKKVIYAINYKTDDLGTKEELKKGIKKNYIMVFNIESNNLIFLNRYSIIDFNNGIIVGSGIDSSNEKHLISIDWDY